MEICQNDQISKLFLLKSLIIRYLWELRNIRMLAMLKRMSVLFFNQSN